MSTLAIREARPDDELQAEEVDRLATATLRTLYRPTDVALQHRAAIVSSVRRLVAVSEKRIVGVVQYHIAADHLSFLGLGVHPSFRRRGVATALIQQLESIGRSCGCTSVLLHTVRETGNVEIFERLGFLVESEEPTTLFQSEKFSALSEVVMRKDLVQDRRPSIIS